MIHKCRAILRVAVFLFTLLIFCELYHRLFTAISASVLHFWPSIFRKEYPSKDALSSLSLTDQQCRSAFPSLVKEIDDVVARGPFELKKEPDDYTGLVQGRIKDGKLYIITAERQPSRDMLWERNAVLHQLHRAILTSPSPLPDTIFTLSILDNPRANSWTFSRPTTLSSTSRYFLMPHFSSWSWPLPFIGTLDEALAKIDTVERETPWEEKIDKVVWRGTAWFNSVGNTDLRPKLLQATKGKEWADVQDLKWGNNGEKAANAIGIEEFCMYKYIVYTEGITYSGRLPFHQSCNSIILTPPLNYLLHTTHLIRPLFSSSLHLSTSSSTTTTNLLPNPLWPTSYPPSSANIIFVNPDWTDLESTISWLRANPEIAKGIASRQRDMFVSKGYLSSAAEACYWRALVRGWSGVARTEEDERWNKSEGMRWETFSLTGKTRWM